MLDRLWRFLGDKENRAVLGWIGGGAVVVAGGLWAAFEPEGASPPQPAAAGGEVTAERVGVVGGVSGGTVSIDQSVTTVNEGASAEDLARIEAKQDAILRALGGPLPAGLTPEQARGILADFGIEEIAADPARIEALLAAKAEELRALQTQLRRLSGDDPQVARLRQEAADLIGAGAFDAARERLTAARDRDRAAREALEARARERRYSEAATEGELGDLARLRLDYRAAADHYAAAAAVLPPEDVEARWRWQLRRAGVLDDLGREFGDNGALGEAIGLYETAALPLAPRETRPLDWAGTQNNLGLALRTLGEREAGTARLEQAADAFRAALEERTRERVPLDWARTQNNLGTALQTLGEREAGTARLEQAVDAYRAALEELTRERVPLHWAGTMFNLGRLHGAMFDKTGDPHRLDLAEQHFAEAWAVFVEAGASRYIALADEKLALIETRRR